MKQFAYAAIAILGAALLFALPGGAHAGGPGGHGGGHGGGFHGFHAGHAGHGAFRRGVRPNIGPLATRRRVIPRNIGPLAGSRYAAGHYHHGRHHSRRHGHDGGLPIGGTALVTDALALQPVETDDAMLADAVPPPLAAHPVIRTVAQSQQACSTEHVKVPSSQGARTTVTIIRC